MPSNKSYAADEQYDAQCDRFPLPWLKLFSEGLELALNVKTYTDKHEISLTLESLRRNRSAREDSDSKPEPATSSSIVSLFCSSPHSAANRVSPACSARANFAHGKRMRPKIMACKRPADVAATISKKPLQTKALPGIANTAELSGGVTSPQWPNAAN
jgi:hypothetical protein